MGKKLLVFLMILSLLGSCVSVLADDHAVEIEIDLPPARLNCHHAVTGFQSAGNR